MFEGHGYIILKSVKRKSASFFELFHLQKKVFINVFFDSNIIDYFLVFFYIIIVNIRLDCVFVNYATYFARPK